jgi:hypothetical protein
MYEIDSKDGVAMLDDVPPCDPGAPLPMLIAGDGEVVLGYLVAESDPQWDGAHAEMVGRGSERESIAIVRFRSPRAHVFGAPNDETLSGHPLYSRGLLPYSAMEVQSSSWIRQLERMNAVHPMHEAIRFQSYRHFVFAFHDSTFECVAHGFDITLFHGSMRGALSHMACLLADSAS